MNRNIVLFFAAIGLFLAHPVSTLACSCSMPPPPTEAMENANAVFAGTVKKIDVADGIILSGDDPVTVTFDVSTVWKGPQEKTLSVTTARSGASCGNSFSEGSEYIVYAFDEEETLTTNLCTRTALLADAGDDLAALSAGTSAASLSAGTPAASSSPQQFIEQYWWLIVALVMWSLPWKGYALWKAARRGDRGWFIAFLFINTLAILEILYIFVWSKRPESEKK